MHNLARTKLFAAAFLLLPSVLLTTPTVAADVDDEENQSWLDNTIARCQQEFTVEQCQDPQFLEEHYHVGTLQTAHRAAARNKGLEQRVLRELLLQRVCNGDISLYCPSDASATCAAQAQQACATIAQQATLCVAQAQQFCADNPQIANCAAQQTARCPSAKKQPLAALLAKYPKLSLQQRTHVAQVAQQLDAASGGNWFGDLLRWIGF